MHIVYVALLPGACRLLRETFEPELLTPGTEFTSLGPNDCVVEVGSGAQLIAARSTALLCPAPLLLGADQVGRRCTPAGTAS